MTLIDYRIPWLEALRDPGFADGYLEECRSLGPGEYEIALQDVAEAKALQLAANSPHNLGDKQQAFYALVAEYLNRPDFGRAAMNS